eukprot:TRINITY_DN623_c0_g1_i1.p1 TRINITY_DN623_c0_g1~~TRINITY_DN623_c0_g1_i1.p1  ORF type:complete len:435 (-),score=58.72 TRINITY_DN623_c0_g1_i1:35-1339(-)
MIKKILKLTVAVMTLGLFTTSVFAADWGASGQARVDWDIAKTIEDADKRNAADLPGGKRTPNGIYIDLDDSWVTLKLSGDSGAFGSITYYPSGAIYYDGGGSVEAGNWTTTAAVNARDIQGQTGQVGSARAGDSDLGDRVGDHTITLAHSSGFSVKAGRTTPLDTFRKGQAYTLMGESGVAAHVTDVASGANVSALDNRSSVVDFGFKVGDSLTLGLAIEQSDSGATPLGAAFGSIGYGYYGPATTCSNQTTCGAPATNTGIKVNYSGGAVNVGVVLVSGAEAGDAALGGDANYKASVSALGLGVGLKFGAVAPFLNIWMPSTKSENAAGNEETSTSNTNIGVDYALNENSGVSLSIVTRASTRKRTAAGAATAVEGETKVSSTELGYTTKVGGANFYLGYVGATISSDPNTATADGDGEVTVSWIKARLQQSF